MPEFQNSDVVKHILGKLIDISSRKTSLGHAVFTVQDLINKLKNKHDFLKNVQVTDTRFVEFGDPISIMTKIDDVKSNDIRNALYDIIKMMNDSLGKDAGHFFIKELRSNIDEDYYSVMEEMGLDLGLMQLEYEVNEMSKKL